MISDSFCNGGRQYSFSVFIYVDVTLSAKTETQKNLLGGFCSDSKRKTSRPASDKTIQNGNLGHSFRRIGKHVSKAAKNAG